MISTFLLMYSSLSSCIGILYFLSYAIELRGCTFHVEHAGILHMRAGSISSEIFNLEPLNDADFRKHSVEHPRSCTVFSPVQTYPYPTPDSPSASSSTLPQFSHRVHCVDITYNELQYIFSLYYTNHGGVLYKP